MFDGKRHIESISNFFLRIGLDWFILAIICMILLGYLWPEPGIQRGYFSLKSIAGYGVSLIFFFYGLKLSPGKLREGLSNWRLHLVVQLSTFIVFPVLVLLMRYAFDPGGNGLLWLGVYFLATLPSTVSSSVVMVSIAGGNVPGAIFNASISSLIGIFVTPLWMGIVLAGSASGFDLTEVILKLVLQVLMPVTLGILLHPRFGRFADRHRAKLRYFDQSVILLIIYTAFAESFAKQMFKGHSAGELVILGIGMVALFFFSTVDFPDWPFAAVQPRGQYHGGILRLQEIVGARHGDVEGAVPPCGVGRRYSSSSYGLPCPSADVGQYYCPGHGS
jgi:sodium/bile acid cotransporter 7